MNDHGRRGADRMNGGGDLFSDRLMIGLRTYINRDSLNEVESQVEDARKNFPSAYMVVALCGEKASKKVKNYADDIIHYSSALIGLTPPFHILLEYAKTNGFEQLILTDGDDQFIFSEIKRIYENGLKNGSDVIIPVRSRKSLFFTDSDIINRTILEELENAFIRLKQDCRLADPQPGLVVILRRDAIETLDLNNVPSMIADLVITSQLLENKFDITEPVVNTRIQKNTRVNLKLEFEKIFQLEDFFKISFFDVLERIKKSNEFFKENMPDFKNIENKYLEFKHSSSV